MQEDKYRPIKKRISEKAMNYNTYEISNIENVVDELNIQIAELKEEIRDLRKDNENE